ncbi:MAG: hypothetical protein IT337_13260 [Thermomicrobiales bacterium]|nr:hypothetical protein [Thermomicrobiales bacterium]
MNFSERRERRAAGGQYVDRRLRMQLRAFTVIFVVVAVLDAVRVVHDRVNPLWAVGGFAAGLALGIVLARIKVLGWNASERAVVGTTDAIGAVILVAYLIFIVFFKGRVVDSQASSATAASVVGLAMTAGAMLGRVAVTMRGIRRMLTAAGFGID